MDFFFSLFSLIFISSIDKTIFFLNRDNWKVIIFKHISTVNYHFLTDLLSFITIFFIFALLLIYNFDIQKFDENINTKLVFIIVSGIYVICYKLSVLYLCCKLI